MMKQLILMLRRPPLLGLGIIMSVAGFYLGTFLLSHLSSLWTVEQAEPAEVSALRFDRKVYDFGTVWQGKKIRHRFKFKNESEEVLKIVRLQTSCSCNAVSVSSEVIPPGGVGEIEAVFDTKGRIGQQSANIYVHLSDPHHSVIALEIKGKVKAEVALIPAELSFGTVKSGQYYAKRIKLINLTESALHITDVRTSSKFISAIPFKNKRGRDKEIGFEVSLLPGHPVGRFRAEVIVHTNNKNHSVLRLPVFGIVLGEITVVPEYFFFGIIYAGERRTITVKIINNSDKELKISRAETKCEFLEVTVSELEGQRKYQIRASLKTDPPLGKIYGMVNVHTNLPSQPVLEIPVYGIARE